jgi:ABC-type Zn uptake system ZnuABC Zn-binding protein ZnuA
MKGYERVHTEKQHVLRCKSFFGLQSLKYTLLILFMTLCFSINGFAGTGGNDDSDHIDAHEPSPGEETLPHVDRVELVAGQKLMVAATTSIVGDVVKNIGGDLIELTVLIEPGQDPHGFEPTPSTIATIERAHVIFVNGFHLEEGLLDIIETTALGVVVPVSAGIEPLDIQGKYGYDDHNDHTDHEEEHHADHDEHHHEHGSVDPHVWFNPNNVMKWAENIAHVLSEADPDNGESYRLNAEEYVKQLALLDQSIHQRFYTLPESKKKLFTDHHVLSYFADEYGFEVIGTLLPSGTTSTEASARRMAELLKLLKRENATTIFVGDTAGRSLRKLSESISEELGEEVSIVMLLTGSLSVPGTPGDTYLGYMEYNVNQIMRGFKL